MKLALLGNTRFSFLHPQNYYLEHDITLHLKVPSIVSEGIACYSILYCITKDIDNKMYSLYQQLKLSVLTCAELEPLLHYALPSEWRTNMWVPWNIFSNEATVPWLNGIWRLMNKDKNYVALAKWPLIPAKDRLVNIEHAKVVVQIPTVPCTEISIAKLLERIGCAIFNDSVFENGVLFPSNLLCNLQSPNEICTCLDSVKSLESITFSAEDAKISFYSSITSFFSVTTIAHTAHLFF